MKFIEKFLRGVRTLIQHCIFMYCWYYGSIWLIKQLIMLDMFIYDDPCLWFVMILGLYVLNEEDK